MSDQNLPPVQTAYDMKAIIVLSGCQSMQYMISIGDNHAAHVLRSFIEAIETIPCEGPKI